MEDSVSTVEEPTAADMAGETNLGQFPHDEPKQCPRICLTGILKILTLPMAAESEADAEPAPFEVAATETEVQELAAEELHVDVNDQIHAAPLDDAEAAKMLAEPAESDPFDLAATAPQLEGFDDLPPADAASTIAQRLRTTPTTRRHSRFQMI